jgi:hypothetical protein
MKGKIEGHQQSQKIFSTGKLLTHLEEGPLTNGKIPFLTVWRTGLFGLI